MSRLVSADVKPRIAVVLLSCLASCGSPSAKPESAKASAGANAADSAAPPAKPLVLPWTKEFDSPALLVADEIRVEGPQGLLAHVAVRVDPAQHDEVQKTIPAGFLQQVTVKAVSDDSEIHGQLDNLTLVATRRLVVLERPAPVDLSVDARGQAVWHDLSTKQEKRADSMHLTGKIAR